MIFPQLSDSAAFWLVMGGVAFSVGALIYGLKRPDPWPGVFGHHEIWHVFVLAGAGAHYVVMFSLIDMPYAPF